MAEFGYILPQSSSNSAAGMCWAVQTDLPFPNVPMSLHRPLASPVVRMSSGIIPSPLCW